uniref:Uncharacterized protein MANES_18G142900 n=1 Tax=Rhizophora mucronata TaxID=61149 RepID=A0A2P2PXB6_RHIMU
MAPPACTVESLPWASAPAQPTPSISRSTKFARSASPVTIQIII